MKWLLSLSLFSPIYSILSNPNGAPGDVMSVVPAYELLAAVANIAICPLCFWSVLSGKPLMKGRKRGTDGLEEMMSSRDRPELENVFKGEY